jgi:tetratricopeptide (TPR) repeat protein
MEIKLKVLAALLLMSLTLIGPESLGRTEWQQQDIAGGARLIFGRPDNPPTHATGKSQTGAQSSQQGGASSATTRLTDKVDDAIALGNAARDREPPDLASAEKAYRLASKLDPRDPRPYVGLGNIYMDQGKYVEAAKSYREAIRVGVPSFRNWSGISSRKTGMGVSSVDNRSDARWHAYLATAWLGQQRAREGERELLDAISMEPGQAQWRALLGYSLFLQNRYTDAAAAYAVAVQLNPANDSYKRLLQEASREAESASANDRSIAKALEDTEWEVRTADNVVKGICQLLVNKSLRCSFADKELPYETLQWKVQDGLLEMTRTVQHGLLGVSQPNLSFPSCIGRIESQNILVKCSLTETETSEKWTKRSKN